MCNNISFDLFKNEDFIINLFIFRHKIFTLYKVL